MSWQTIKEAFFLWRTIRCLREELRAESSLVDSLLAALAEADPLYFQRKAIEANPRLQVSISGIEAPQ